MKFGLTGLVHGLSGVGKSRLLATANPPVCFLDLEGRARFVPGEKIAWDVDSQDPPEVGDWTHAIVTTTKYGTLERAFAWLQTDRHPFKSVVVDSLSFAQKRFIKDLVGTSSLQQQDWGEVLRSLESLVRDYCDLVIQPHTPIETVVFSAGTKHEDNRQLPLLQGALKDSAAYLFDFVGYMYLAANQSGEQTRNLLIEPQAGIVAKDNTDLLQGPVVQSPNLGQLHSLLVEGLTQQKEN